MALNKLDQFRRTIEEKQKDPLSKDSYADKQVRLLINSLRIFDPLVSASLYAKQYANDPVAISGSDFASNPDAVQDKIRKVSVMWGQSTSLMGHLEKDFDAIGVDLQHPGNRWMYRKLIPIATNLVAKAHVNERNFDFSVLARTLSAVATMVTGKAMPGIGDESVANALISEFHSSEDSPKFEALQEDEPYYTLDPSEAVHIAKIQVMSNLATEVDDFAFMQSAKSNDAKLRIVAQLGEVVNECAATLYQRTVGIDSNGEPSDEIATTASSDSRRMLMMRCIHEAGLYTARAYRSLGQQAVRDIVSKRGDKAAYDQVRMQYYEQGVPYEKIRANTLEAGEILSSAAVSGSAFLRQLIDNPLLDERNEKTSTHGQTVAPSQAPAESYAEEPDFQPDFNNTPTPNETKQADDSGKFEADPFNDAYDDTEGRHP